jgi:radical SAM-linked protein
MQKFAVTFRKGDDARFLSHLDLTAMLEYAVRRAGLPVSLSEGFSPRPRLSVAASLALGYVGEAELFELTLRDSVAPTAVGERLSAVLPAGIQIVSVEKVEPGAKSAASRLQSAVYRIDLPAPVDDLQQRIEDLLRRPSLEVEEPRDGHVRRRDLRPMLLRLHEVSPASLRLEVRMDGEGSMRPEQVLALMDLPAAGARITREQIVLWP